MSKRIPIIMGIILICIAVWLLITPSKFVRTLVERLDHLGYDLQLRTRILTERKIYPTNLIPIIYFYF